MEGNSDRITSNYLPLDPLRMASTVASKYKTDGTLSKSKLRFGSLHNKISPLFATFEHCQALHTLQKP